MRVLVRARPQTHGAHLSIDSRYNEGYIATLERAVRGGRPVRHRFDRGMSVEALGCIERCVRSHAASCHLARSEVAAGLVSRLPTYTAYKSCVLFDYAMRLCGPLFILDLMPL